MTPQRFAELRHKANEILLAAQKGEGPSVQLAYDIHELLDAIDAEDRRATAAIRALKAALEP